MKHVVLLFFIAVVVLSGCTTPSNLKDFESLCKEYGHMWMHMAPMMNGDIISKEACWGCMPDAKNHICDEKEYTSYLDKHADDMMDMHDKMMKMMHGKTMKAHAGMKNNVEIHDDLVTFDHPAYRTGEDKSLTFVITDQESNTPVTDLEIVHEKPMHVILMRKDLTYFDHLHPRLEKNKWVVPYTFLAPGEYRVWVDFTDDDMQHLIDFDFVVSGETIREEPNRLDGLHAEMHAPNHISTGEDISLDFSVSDENGPVPITETFLGADAHLIIVDETLEEFIHDHDMSADNDNTLSFMPAFTKPGKHVAWVQFSVGGIDRAAPFVFQVEGDGS